MERERNRVEARKKNIASQKIVQLVACSTIPNLETPRAKIHLLQWSKATCYYIYSMYHEIIKQKSPRVASFIICNSRSFKQTLLQDENSKNQIIIFVRALKEKKTNKCTNWNGQEAHLCMMPSECVVAHLQLDNLLSYCSATLNLYIPLLLCKEQRKPATIQGRTVVLTWHAILATRSSHVARLMQLP